ncbi:unnamed protein product [Notodromas monacha]|uniref:Conserved oligomeric Golgi complex subunit 3 n=1 Tax=Notodromas monacha TaxID=399045 RepID=A0A7R9BLA4_9CRUS|nr:unnamed protein product [Notodromas monacha]CAG0917309.1 unnamed protein product [Notodromas monacha]
MKGGVGFWYDLVLKWDDPAESIAPLTDQQRDVISEFGALAYERPLPRKFLVMEEVSSDRRRCLSSGEFYSDSEDEYIAEDDRVRSDSFAALEEDDFCIATAHQFLTWYDSLEKDMILDEVSSYAKYLANLRRTGLTCVEAQRTVEGVIDDLQKLLVAQETVCKETNLLHAACEKLLEEQEAMSGKAEKINEELKYFEIVENLPVFDSFGSIQSSDFISTLAKLDAATEFFREHASYKDSSEYLSKCDAALYRGLVMVRGFVSASLVNAFEEIYPWVTTGGSFLGGGAPQKKEQIRALNVDQAYPYLYARFSANSATLKRCVAEIECRVKSFALAEGILSDIHGFYFSKRKQLIVPVFQSQMKEIVEECAFFYRSESMIYELNIHFPRDKCSMLRSGSHALKAVCHDEAELFGHFFSSQNTGALSQFLAELSGVVYDCFRPIFVHVVHLETLTELCVVGKAELMDVRSNDTNKEWMEPFNEMLTQILEDVRERLVYATHVFIKRDITGFSPSAGDLAYPEKLKMMEEIARTCVADGNSSRSSTVKSVFSMDTKNLRSHTGASPADLMGMWYPVVKRTLVCLSKLHRSLDKTSFQGLSQEALSACVAALVNAAERIPKLNAAHSYMDADLFLIKHLLILREQIHPFNSEFIIKEMAMDFSKMKDAAKRLLTKRHLLRFGAPSAILELLLEGVPDVIELVLDSKKDIDMQLKCSCADLIFHTVSTVTKPLNAFVDDYKETKNVVDHGTVGMVCTAAVRNLKSILPTYLSQLRLYLANADTEFILFRPVKLGILNAFHSFDTLTKELYSEEECRIINCPPKQQLNVMMANMAL